MASARPIRITPVTWRASLAADNLDTPAGGALPGAGSARASVYPYRLPDALGVGLRQGLARLCDETRCKEPFLSDPKGFGYPVFRRAFLAAAY